MNGIIESLKTRRALNNSMLNPGKTAGSDLLLNTSSLQPQTIFRQTTASFSVRRPRMTSLSMKSMSSFSNQAGEKYKEGTSLLHIKPASSGANTTPTVAREPASMPLPVSGGTMGQTAADSVPSLSASASSGSSPFPPKSERRPVMFEKTDGPSDLEKRIMAAKKQKQDAEAKKRGPDRRRVRTERVEISSSSSDSGEVNREFFPGAVKPQPSEISPVKSETVKPDAGTSRGSSVIQREFQPAPSESSQKVSPASSQESIPAASVQREMQNDGSVSHQKNQVKSAAPAASVHTTSPKAETIQREMPQAAPLPSEPESPAEMPLVRRAENEPDTVEREMDESAPVSDTTAQNPSPLVQPAGKADTIRREIKSASPVSKKSAVTNPAPAKRVISAKTVQREIRTDSPADSVTKSEPMSVAAPETADTIQREVQAAAPVKATETDKNITDMPVVSQPEIGQNLIQRETEPNAAAAENKPMPQDNLQDVNAAAENPVIRRETEKPVPAAKEIKPSAEAAQKAGNNAVQRESIPEAQMQKAHLLQNSASEKDAVRREPIPEAQMQEAHLLQDSAPDKDAVQRESIPDMVLPKTHLSQPQGEADADTVRRELFPDAEMPQAHAVQKEKSEKVSAAPSSVTVQREVIPEAAPIETESSLPDLTLPKANVSDETVQREIDVPPAEKMNVVQRQTDTGPAAAKHASKGKSSTVPAAQPTAAREFEPAHPVESTVQREALRSAEPISAARQDTPAAPVVRRETADAAGSDGPEPSLSELMKGLPTHYSMPHDQVEAIRSGRPYTPPAQKSAEAGSVVQREMAAPAAQPSSSQKAAPDLVLPKQMKESSSAGSSENTSSAGSKSMFDPSNPFGGIPTGLPGFGQAPRSSSGPNIPTGNHGGFGGNHSFTPEKPSGLVQRELLDDSDAVNEPSASVDISEPEVPANEEAEKAIEELMPEVTPQQLSELADKLLPRIKRIMRNEMERSIFR